MSLYDVTTYPFQTNYVEDIPSIPIECFLKPDEMLREAFKKGIEKFDILYVEVANLGNTDNTTIMVRIISKVDEANSFVYHLNINAYLFRRGELNRMDLTDIENSQLLKVVVLGRTTVKGVQKHYATMNLSVLPEDKAHIHLGIVEPSDLPHNLNSFKVASKFMSYAQYLRSYPNKLKFQNLKELIQSLGVDLYRIYSLSENRDGTEFSLDSCIDALLAKAELALHLESKKHLDEACKFIINKEYICALSSFDEALKCWPKNYEVFEKRGKMYAGLIKYHHELLKKAIKDFEDALSLNKSAQEAKVEYSKLLVIIAKRERKRRKNLEKAKLCCFQAIKLDINNENAIKLMKRIEKDMKIKNEIRQLEILQELLKKQLKTEK